MTNWHTIADRDAQPLTLAGVRPDYQAGELFDTADLKVEPAPRKTTAPAVNDDQMDLFGPVLPSATLTSGEVLAALAACTVPVTTDTLASKLGQTEHSVALVLAKLANTGTLVHGRRAGGKARFGKVPNFTTGTTHLWATPENVAAWKAEQQ
jgi:hypothetical protein